MASQHRRIALTADPELEAAISAARREIGDIAESRLVRELALRGARDLQPDDAARAIAELKRKGAVWPSRSLADVLASQPPLGAPDVANPRPGTQALEDTRADRI